MDVAEIRGLYFALCESDRITLVREIMGGIDVYNFSGVDDATVSRILEELRAVHKALCSVTEAPPGRLGAGGTAPHNERETMNEFDRIRNVLAELLDWAHEANSRIAYEIAPDGRQYGGNPYLNPTFKSALAALDATTNVRDDDDRETLAPGDEHYQCPPGASGK